MAKRPTNVSIDAALLQKARELDINLSATIEAALQELIRRRQRENWLAANGEVVADYNRRIEQHGAFSDRLRSF